MSLVDVHVHLAESKAIGRFAKDGYEIWEYGAKEGVRFSDAAGDLDDLRVAMLGGSVGHAVVVNTFTIDEWRGRWLTGLDRSNPASLGAQLIQFNEWLVEAAATMPEITPFVAVDPWVLSVEETAAHLTEMRRHGARGVKIHPVEQRFLPADPRMLRIFRVCAELGLSVLSHSGSSRGEVQFAEPRAFADVARAIPELRLVVAHLGGGSWTQIPELAARHPQIAFDLCEIIAWVGAPQAPSREQLVQLIREVGAERVMFGSDFPWYDPGEMATAVEMLPGLSEKELDGILGGNATRILSLP